MLDQTDPNNVAGIVKLFFRELKSPLLPLKYISAVIADEKEFLGNIQEYAGFRLSAPSTINFVYATGKELRLQIQDVVKVYQSLPAINQSTIKYFMEHIAR